MTACTHDYVNGAATTSMHLRKCTVYTVYTQSTGVTLRRGTLFSRSTLTPRPLSLFALCQHSGARVTVSAPALAGTVAVTAYTGTAPLPSP